MPPFLTSQERQAYGTLPSEITHREIVQYFTLTPDDLAAARTCYGAPLQFGFAMQIGLLRWLGRFPDHLEHPPAQAIEFIAEQLGVSPGVMKKYRDLERTARRHRDRIVKHLGYREFDNAKASVTTWLLSLAMEHDFARGLLDALIEHLQRKKIVRPSISSLERLVAEARDQAEDKIGRLINRQLNAKQRQAQDELLLVPEGETISRLQWLKEPPPHATAKRLLEWLKKIEACRVLGADKLDLADVHPNRIKLLARRARQKSNWEIKRADETQQRVLLACFLHEALQDITDQAIEMQMQLIYRIFRRAERKRDAEFAAEGQAINDKVLLFNKIGRIILNEKNVPNMKVRPQVYERVIPREQLAEAVTEGKALARPADSMHCPTPSGVIRTSASSRLSS